MGLTGGSNLSNERTHSPSESSRHLGYADALIANSADILAVIDINAALLYANPAAERILGWNVEDQRGRTMLDLVHPDDLDQVIAAFVDTLRAPGIHPMLAYRMRTPTGQWLCIESTGNNQLHDPLVAGIVINARDVTAQISLATQVARSQRGLVSALARLSESRDPYTAGHQRSVAEISLALCRRLQIEQAQTLRISMAAELHDLGKMAIPAEILSKPGRLDDAERVLVERHARLGHQLLEGLDLPEEVPDVALHHHERLDGSGYPDTLRGSEITEASRIVAVADVLDAISSHRPYRPALGMTFALDHIEAGRGSLYDDAVVTAALAELRTSVV